MAVPVLWSSKLRRVVNRFYGWFGEAEDGGINKRPLCRSFSLSRINIPILIGRVTL